jgi:hypothetical protein
LSTLHVQSALNQCGNRGGICGQSTPLRNDGAAKSAILDFVAREVAYAREFQLSPLAEALDKAKDPRIKVVSMRRDWKRCSIRTHESEANAKEWLVLVSEHAIVLIDALALVIILYGTVEAFIRALHERQQASAKELGG